MGGKKSKHRGNDQELLKLNQIIEDLRQKVKKADAEYENVRKFYEEWKKVKHISTGEPDYILLYGPKGSGKTTFLALRGVPVEPSASTRDGTTEISAYTDPSGVRFLDTIGLDVHSESILKMLAYFLYVGFPSAIILFHNGRYLEPVEILSEWFKVKDPYLCRIDGHGLAAKCRNPKLNPNQKTLPEFFLTHFKTPSEKEDIYRSMHEPHHITHLDEIDPSRGSFDTVKALLYDDQFPNSQISSSLSPELLLKYRVFEQLMKFHEIHKRHNGDLETATKVFFSLTRSKM